MTADMASPRKSAKQSSGWGGFLQQAVLSVESRLDTILADEDQHPAKATTSGSNQEPAERASADISRSSSAARTNDRLQERLARALAKKNNDGRNDSPASTSERVPTMIVPVESFSDENRVAKTSNRQRDGTSEVEISRPSFAEGPFITADARNADKVDLTNSKGVPDSLEDQSEYTALSQANTPLRQSVDEEGRSGTPNVVANGVKGPDEGASAEEMYSYIEKIDALQAKLQYLTKEAAASAHDAAAAAKMGSVERKLLEKDEKIALLMEEGQKLSKTEMKHLVMIKKLRSQAAEISKSHSTVKARAEKGEANAASAEQRASRAEAAMRRAEENLEASLDADRDLEALRNERDALTATVAEIRAQLALAMKRAENAESKAQSDVVSQEKKQIANLKDDLVSSRIERDISEEKLRREIRELQVSLVGEKERSMSLEGELRAEQSLLENKMESLRNRAEEVTSSSVGDSQAKLLRQIESLQNQYAVASENWQGIEGSLLARIANIQMERDSVEQREGDLRKKIREATLKAKAAEKESESIKDAVYQTEQSLSELKSEAQHLRRKLEEREESLADIRKELETQQKRSEAEFSRRLEEERNKWKEHISVPSPILRRNESPISSMRKGSGYGPGFEQIAISIAGDRSLTRRSPALPYSSRTSNTPPPQNPSASAYPSINGKAPETPSSQIIDQDEYFAEPATPASLGTHRGMNDLMSISTVGAGPSVQLVERMSASVRRLESEKAASKDELARLTAQRDDSRKEVVALMREVEERRANDEKIKALEEELRLVNERHQTTLEMLGEKSEMVEELKADVADVKQMYRDLVDSTMK